MANLTVNQMTLAKGAIVKHFIYGASLAASTVVNQALGDAPAANEVVVLLSATLKNTHATTSTPFHATITDGSSGTPMTYIISEDGAAPSVVGTGAPMVCTTPGNQMYLSAGASLGAIGNYTGDYIITGTYCIIRNLGVQN